MQCGRLMPIGNGADSPRTRYALPMATITIPRRTLIIIGAAVVALLLAIVILVSVLISTINRAASEADYRQCMADRGVSVTSGESVEQYADRAAQAAASCSR